MSETAFYFGDANDDDGEVIDNLIESDPIPPEADELPQVRGPETVIYRPVFSSLITETRSYPANSGPIQILNDDPNRRSAKVVIHGNEVDVAIANSPTALSGAMSTAFIISGPGEFELNDYTGPLWISAAPDSDISKKYSYSLIAVTGVSK